MQIYPKIIRNKNEIEIWVSSFNGVTKHLNVEFILDFDQFQDIIGIEIINLKTKVGVNCLDIIEKVICSIGEELRYAYDASTDSFYLQIVKERSIDQKAIYGVLALNAKGNILGFKAMWNDRNG